MYKCYGLVGEKLSHSYSPKIHNIILKELKMDACYNLFEVKEDKLKVAIEGLKALGAVGVNVTIPYKVKVIDYLDSVSKEAREIGAVNTISFDDGRTCGFNTDYFGFGMLIDKYNIDIRGKRAVILGTGGAAKAVYEYLKDNGILDILFVSRNPELFNKRCVSYNELEKLNGFDIIVNCTPVGMFPNVNNSPVDKNILKKFQTAVDIIFNPYETLFLKYARENGLKTANGMYMLIGQAVASEELWHGMVIDKKLIDMINESLIY